MFPKYYYYPLKTVARANFPPFPPYYHPIKKALEKSKILVKMKEYVCHVSSKSLENCDL